VAAAAALTVSAGAAAAAQAAPLWKFTTKGAYSYVSVPKLHPPKLSWKLQRHAKLAHGYFMLGNFPDLSQNTPMVGQSGPLMVDSHGQPVWFRPVSTKVVADNLTLQRYNGKPALSYWQGVVTDTGQITSGEDVVVDQHYKTVATLKAASPWVVALHEFVISGHNAWVVASRTLPGSAHGGPAKSTLIDTAVQEYDLQSGQLLYTWDPLDHVPTSASYQGPLVSGLWDPYHLNSVQLTGNGTFLVSLRNTSAAYLIDKTSGGIVWTLGGKHSTFAVASNAQFAFQHDVQLHSGNTVSMFDDHCCQMTAKGKFVNPTGPSRGLVLALDMTKHTASLVSQASRGRNFHTAFLGNDQLLSNGNSLVGWGSQPYFDEYDKSGKLLLDVTLPGPDRSYRAYQQRWVGLPSYPPNGGVKKSGSTATVYASWDGSTQVAKWRVLAGSSSSHLAAVATKSKRGFETAIGLPTSYKTYKVVALDSKGKVLGTSHGFPSSGPHFGRY
jgi:hypothetical protein